MLRASERLPDNLSGRMNRKNRTPFAEDEFRSLLQTARSVNAKDVLGEIFYDAARNIRDRWSDRDDAGHHRDWDEDDGDHNRDHSWDGEWNTDSEGEWVDVEGEPPTNAPLSVLGDSASLAVVSSDSPSSILSGVLCPAAGIASGIPITITVQDGSVVEISYEADPTGQVAMVTTTLTEIGTAGIVTRPEGA